MSVQVHAVEATKVCDYCRVQTVNDLVSYGIDPAKDCDFTKLPKGIWEINDTFACASHLNDACNEAVGR